MTLFVYTPGRTARRCGVARLSGGRAATVGRPPESQREQCFPHGARRRPVNVQHSQLCRWV